MFWRIGDAPGIVTVSPKKAPSKRHQRLSSTRLTRKIRGFVMCSEKPFLMWVQLNIQFGGKIGCAG